MIETIYIEEKIKNQIIKYSEFDIIIDDGSHNSDDIVRSFCNYFNHLKDDGLYIIEDLHCSYHQQHRGGIFYPISSINFFNFIASISWRYGGFEFIYGVSKIFTMSLKSLS